MTDAPPSETSHPKATTTTTKMRLPNVKELAKRFESGTRIEPRAVSNNNNNAPKRIGKFWLAENRPSTSRVVPRATPARRKSSLKRRTRSIELAIVTSSSDFRKSKSIGDFSVPAAAPAQPITPLPAPRRLPAQPNMLFEQAKNDESPAPPPPPPLPSAPPSRERIQRIPSYLKPTPAPRSLSGQASTLPRSPRLTTPPPPPPAQSQPGTLPINSFPRIPSIPVPDVPCSEHIANEDEDDDNCYEEIMLVTPNDSDASVTYRTTHQPVYFYESTDFTSPSPSVSNDNHNKHYPRDEEIFDEAEEEDHQNFPAQALPKIKERFLSATLQRNPRNSPKRMSSIELEKLFRFKSELQLNLSRKAKKPIFRHFHIIAILVKRG
uniref:Uncharacterized protein n=1 Tax=Caenorhabditis japonica TaxID=281687 RepID=A0A8R1DI66_CAEJA